MAIVTLQVTAKSLTSKWIGSQPYCEQSSPEEEPSTEPVGTKVFVREGAEETVPNTSTTCPSGTMTSNVVTFTLRDQFGNIINAVEDITINITVDFRYVSTVQLPPGEQPVDVVIPVGQSEATYLSYTRDEDNGQGGCENEAEIYIRTNSVSPSKYTLDIA